MYVGNSETACISHSVLHPNLVLAALTVAALESDLAFTNRLIKLLQETNDAVLQDHFVSMLSQHVKPLFVNCVRAAIYDPNTRRRDAGQLFRRLGHNADTRRSMFDWIKRDYDKLKTHLPNSQKRWTVWRTSTFCDTESHDEIKLFFSERVKAYRGAPRALIDVLEHVRLCAAIADKQRVNTIRVFSAQAN